ncbi:MAG: diguanylate cyclase [Thermodesulfobacteriota bacterium]|nr:diguanylate cyclase [Thermodesulfobacteriota bacterium]
MKHFPGYEIQQKIGETRHSVIYRAQPTGASHTVAIKTFKSLRPSPADLARLRHEFKLIQHANVDGIVQIFDIIDAETGVALVMEDFFGISLKSLLMRERLDLERFLDLAIRLAETIGNLHKNNIIHRDIKPSNILYNADRNVLKITDFGLAAELDRIEEELYHPETMEGTLAYMSPEQTGRMNRAVDHRSDLYSLGITFYEILVRGVPFMGEDPMEIIYAHIAKPPTPPHVINPSIPEIISGIIMKLLSKTAEERYQNSFGLMADLEACRRQLLDKGNIIPFELGTRDISLKFHIPQVLVGRNAEIDALQRALDRTAAGTAEAFLVAGEPGAGKSTLVNELQKSITGKKGYFIAGKYDQLRRHVPYSAIIQAFQSLVRHLLSENEQRLDQWRERIARALEPNGRIITDAIPEVALIIGPQPDIPELGTEEARNRFNLVFKNFVKVFADPAHPLVLFLDDLQWVGTASLNLIQEIVTDKSLSHFFLIGAYRNNEIAEHHPLMLCVEEIQKKGITVEILSLGLLDVASVQELIVNFLRCDTDTAAPLAAVIHAKSLGNPFFVIQFLKTLYEEGYLTIDADSGWVWDINAIRKMQVTDNVVEFMTAKLARLPASSLDILTTCACIGNRFDIESLSTVLGLSLEAVITTIDDLTALGFISSSDGQYRFHHDRIQEAAYALVPDENREALHYHIGEYMLNRTPPEKLYSQIYYITDQFNQASGLIKTDEEKERLADLNCKAGIRAKEANAYAAAADYLGAGMGFLPDNAWENAYELTYTLHTERMTCEYLNQNFETAAALFEAINRNVENRVDRAKACHAMVVLYTNVGRLNEAIDLGIESIRMFGVRLSKKCGKGAVLLAYIRFRQKLKQTGIDSILKIPESNDPERIWQNELYGGIGLPAYLTNPNLFVMTILKGVTGDLCHGLTHTSAFGIMGIAPIVGSIFGDFQTAYHLGETAIKLNEKMTDKRHAAKVHFVFGFFVRHWIRPLKESYEDCRKAYELGLENGDLVYCGHCINEMMMIPLLTGSYVDEVLASHERFRDFQENVQDPFAINQFKQYKQFCLNLKGLTENPDSLNTPDYNHDAAIKEMRRQNNMLNVFYMLLLRENVNYLHGNYEEAYRIGFEMDPLLEFPRGSYYLPQHFYFRCLSMLAVYPDKPASEQRRIVKQVKRMKKDLKKWGQSAPSNYRHMHLLVKAEESAVWGHDFQAATLYRQAIQSARENGYLFYDALANEQAARFYMDRGLTEISALYLREAYNTFYKWGADGKSRQMEKSHPFLMEKETKTGNYLDTQTASSGSGITSDVLDFSTVMKVSQAISSEIMLDKLLGRIMKIAVMYAGAGKGFFLLDTDGRLTVEAVQKEDQEEVQMMESVDVDACNDISIAIVHYVHRSGENVILDDATREGVFKNDPHILRNQSKSILAIPIRHKGETSGLLYMENNLSANAFTTERIEILQVIAAQAAISIENARLFEQATIDGLTRLFVRRYFHLLLDKEIERAGRHNRIFSLVMMDIDHFKQFNDNYGHQLGDEVLQRVAKTIRRNCRENDVAARFGGEEFLLLLPETDINGAMEAAEKLRRAVEALNIPFQTRQLHVTISLGVATFPFHAQTAVSLIESADKALYESKNTGRNRVTAGEKAPSDIRLATQ